MNDVYDRIEDAIQLLSQENPHLNIKFRINYLVLPTNKIIRLYTISDSSLVKSEVLVERVQEMSVEEMKEYLSKYII